MSLLHRSDLDLMAGSAKSHVGAWEASHRSFFGVGFSSCQVVLHIAIV